MLSRVARAASRAAGGLAVAWAVACGTSPGPDVGSKAPGPSPEPLSTGASTPAELEPPSSVAPPSAGGSTSGPSGQYQVARQLVLDTTTGLRWQQWSEPGRYDWLLASAVCHRKGMRLPTAAELRALRLPNANAVCGVDSTTFLGERCVTLQTQEGVAFSAMTGDVVPVTGPLAVRCVE